MATIQEGLSLALERELTPVAAEVYQRLGTAQEIAGDYAGARDALGTALGLCDATGDGPAPDLRELHGLRPARARRVGPGARALRRT